MGQYGLILYIVKSYNYNDAFGTTPHTRSYVRMYVRRMHIQSKVSNRKSCQLFHDPVALCAQQSARAYP